MKVMLREIRSEAAFCERLTAELQAAMDAELTKPEGEIDFELLDDLADALLLLSNSNGEGAALTPATVRKFRTRVRLSALWKALGSTAAMAAVAFLCYTAMNEKEPQPLPVEATTTVTVTTTAPAEETTAPTTATTEALTETTTDSPRETAAVTATATATETTAAEEGYRPVQGAEAPDSDDEGKDGSPDEDSAYEYGGEAGGTGGVLGGGRQMYLGFTGAFQKHYAVGEAFNPSGIVVTIGGESQSRVVDLSACSISGFSSDTAGTKTVTVHYQNYQASFTVEVMEE